MLIDASSQALEPPTQNQYKDGRVDRGTDGRGRYMGGTATEERGFEALLVLVVGSHQLMPKGTFSYPDILVAVPWL